MPILMHMLFFSFLSSNFELSSPISRAHNSDYKRKMFSDSPKRRNQKHCYLKKKEKRTLQGKTIKGKEELNHHQNGL